MFSYGTGGLRTLPLHLVSSLWRPASGCVCGPSSHPSPPRSPLPLSLRFPLASCGVSCVVCHSHPSRHILHCQHHHNHHNPFLSACSRSALHSGHSVCFWFECWMIRRLSVSLPFSFCVEGPIERPAPVTSGPFAIVQSRSGHTFIIFIVSTCCVACVCVGVLCVCVCVCMNV